MLRSPEGSACSGEVSSSDFTRPMNADWPRFPGVLAQTQVTQPQNRQIESSCDSTALQHQKELQPGVFSGARLERRLRGTAPAFQNCQVSSDFDDRVSRSCAVSSGVSLLQRDALSRNFANARASVSAAGDLEALVTSSRAPQRLPDDLPNGSSTASSLHRTSSRGLPSLESGSRGVAGTSVGRGLMLDGFSKTTLSARYSVTSYTGRAQTPTDKPVNGGAGNSLCTTSFRERRAADGRPLSCGTPQATFSLSGTQSLREKTLLGELSMDCKRDRFQADRSSKFTTSRRRDSGSSGTVAATGEDSENLACSKHSCSGTLEEGTVIYCRSSSKSNL